MDSKENITINQILDRKSRGLDELDGIARVTPILSKLARISDIKELHDALNRNRDVEDNIDIFNVDYDLSIEEWSNYIVVASVACLESYVKSIYKHLIDDHDKFIGNISNSKNISFNLKTAIELKKHSLTLGDLVSHSLSASNYENIVKHLGLILGIRFEKEMLHQYKKYLKEVNDIQQSLFETNENEIQENINIQVVEFITKTKSMISARHMICHEISYSRSLEDEVFNTEPYENVRTFISLTERVIASTLEAK